ncbi:MAG: DUF5716 family protein [Spirochaetia bacterium]|nr:DUF5716 family protein [Spirochaetia bacterium]
MAKTLFSEVPESFFSPLASKHKVHYSELLLCYYRLFETYSTGVERELVIGSFTEYITERSGLLSHPSELFDDPEESAVSGLSYVPSDESAGTQIGNAGTFARNIASMFLRRLISCGWMSEEILADYTEVINITMWSRLFYTAIAETVKGSSMEYESHVIGIYSAICSDAVEEQGAHAVLIGLDHTRRLIESLKTLSQNMKTHIESMFSEDAEVRDLLHIHYDLYMHEIVDKAYNRLKTSDNLSKYRPLITSQINALLQQDIWLLKSAHKLSVMRGCTKEEAHASLCSMLREIRDELRNIDPILEEIDDKNRQYSRISTEKIKSQVYADASLKGKVQKIIRGMKEEETAYLLLRPNIRRTALVQDRSLFTPRVSRQAEMTVEKPSVPEDDMEQIELEMRMRIAHQLNHEKICAFLSEHCHADGSPTEATELIGSMEDLVRVIYAAAYAEGREHRFPYTVVWGDRPVRWGRYEFLEHRFIPKGKIDHGA